MRRLTLSLAIGTLAIGLASAAQAQDTTRRTSGGEVAKTPTYSSLITALNNSSQAVDNLKKLTTIDPTNIRIVDSKPLVTTSNEAEFNSAQTKNAAAIADLRAEIQKHDEVTKALSNHAMKLTPTDVVAAQVGSAGEILLYFNKPM